MAFLNSKTLHIFLKNSSFMFVHRTGSGTVELANGPSVFQLTIQCGFPKFVYIKNIIVTSEPGYLCSI